MSKTLIIAEKPSVANDIARAVGGCVKKDDHHENDQYVIASAVGHLLELVVPEEYEIKRGKWSFTHLPHIPPHFDLKPIVKSEARLKSLAKLLRRKDVDHVINACDAGREGELIFRYIMQYTKAKQPSQRLWLQSMTPQAIRDGLADLRTDAQMLNLADAARSRSEADWLVGINGTRAMTAFNSRDGGFFLTTVGRVQTPTLTIVVEREEAIRKFVSRDYWEVHAEFVPPPCQLKAVGVVHEEKQNEQRQPVQHRDERQQPVYGAALHALEEHHHVLMRQGENDVKRDDRDEQGCEKQPVFPAAAAAVACNKFREHLHCPLPAAT